MSVNSASGSRLRLLLVNSSANLIRALSSSAINVVLPVILVIALAPTLYPVWALAFSLSAFVLYLDLGVPTSVQALVGRASANGSTRSSLSATRSGLAITAVAGIFSILVLASAGIGASLLFPDLPARYAPEFAVTLIILGAGQVLGLLANVLGAFFSGNQRSHVPMFVLVPGRLLSAALAVILALTTGDIRLAAVGFAIPLLVSTVILGVLLLRERAGIQTLSGASVGILSLLKYSGPLIVWNISMLLITGLGVVLVGRFDFAAVALYSLAMVAVAGLSAVEASLTAPLLPELGRRWETSAMIPGVLDGVLRTFLRLNATFIAVASAGVVLGGALVLELGWLDEGVAIQNASLILCVVLVATALRLAMTPLSLAYIASKTHTRVVFPPVIEAAVNLAASVGLGLWLGALGVALGYLVGAVLGVAMMIGWAMRRSGVVRLPPVEVVRLTVLRPMLPLVFAMSGVLILDLSDFPLIVSVLLLVVLGVAALLVAWFVARKDIGILRSRGVRQ